MPRPQFTLRALLVVMLVVGAFLGGVRAGIHLERERVALETARNMELWSKEAMDDLCGGVDPGPPP